MTSPFISKNYALYRRDELIMKCHFDLDNTEGSINQDKLILKNFTAIIDERVPNRPSYSTPNVSEWTKTRLPDGSYYNSLVIHGGWLELSIDPNFNPHALCEVSYDYANPGTGQLDIWVNGMFTETRVGPSPWRASAPHKAIDDLVLRCRQRNFGVSDPPGRAEIDNLCVYKYKELDIDVSEYTPPKASSGPKIVDTLKGYSFYQTTKFIGTDIQMTLTFSSASSHDEFLINIDKPHVFCDDKGTYYRGVIELLENKRIGINLYQQQIMFRSPNKLGEGWK